MVWLKIFLLYLNEWYNYWTTDFLWETLKWFLWLEVGLQINKISHNFKGESKLSSMNFEMIIVGFRVTMWKNEKKKKTMPKNIIKIWGKKMILFDVGFALLLV